MIGVAQDVHYNGVDESAPTIVYWPAIREIPGSEQFTPRSRCSRSEAAGLGRRPFSLKCSKPYGR